MVLTEDDAKTKWCPMIRKGEQMCGGTENRPDGSYNCIASDCMMWRWRMEPVTHPDSGRLTRWQQTEKGFCGLSGMPTS